MNKLIKEDIKRLREFARKEGCRLTVRKSLVPSKDHLGTYSSNHAIAIKTPDINWKLLVLVILHELCHHVGYKKRGNDSLEKKAFKTAHLDVSEWSREALYAYYLVEKRDIALMDKLYKKLNLQSVTIQEVQAEQAIDTYMYEHMWREGQFPTAAENAVICRSARLAFGSNIRKYRSKQKAIPKKRK